MGPNEAYSVLGARIPDLYEAKGNLVPDAFLAAPAIETGSEFITADRDYNRFPGLRVRHPVHV